MHGHDGDDLEESIKAADARFPGHRNRVEAGVAATRTVESLPVPRFDVRTGSIPGLLDRGAPVIHRKHGRGTVWDPTEPTVPVIFQQTRGVQGSMLFMEHGLAEVDLDLSIWQGRTFALRWISGAGHPDHLPPAVYSQPAWDKIRAALEAKGPAYPQLPPFIVGLNLYEGLSRDIGGLSLIPEQQTLLHEVLLGLYLWEA